MVNDTLHRFSRLTLLASAIAVTLMLVQASVFAGTCTTAVVEETFVLPDGSEQPAGQLSLCIERQFSPVQSLHEVMIDGMPIGMALSRHGDSGITDSSQAAMIFTRGVDGRLFLRGYTTPSRETMNVYTLQRPKGRLNATSRNFATQIDEPVILVAALDN